MKHLTLISVFCFCVSAFAVTTENCPKGFTVNYGQLIPSSDKSFEKQMAGKSEEVVRSFSAARDVLKEGRYSTHRNLMFQLVEAKSSQCSYRGGDDQLTTRFYTRNGKDFLNVVFKLDGHELSIRHDIFGYSTDHFDIESRPAMPVLISIADRKYKLGWAIGFDISVGKD